jgi:hypothetical protein
LSVTSARDKEETDCTVICLSLLPETKKTEPRKLDPSRGREGRDKFTGIRLLALLEAKKKEMGVVASQSNE